MRKKLCALKNKHLDLSLCKGEVIPQKGSNKKWQVLCCRHAKHCFPGLVSECWHLGSCSIVSMPILKCIQFSSVWEAGDPGTGRVTSGCNYTKSGGILNAEEQSWIQCWTEVGSDWLMSSLRVEAVESPSLKMSKTQLDVVPHNLI